MQILADTRLHHNAGSKSFVFGPVDYFIAVGSLRKKLCDAAKILTSDDSVHVPLQIVQYKTSAGEAFGKSFDTRHKIESATSVEYDPKWLFNEE